MADVKAVCNNTCGCVVPCPGGVECRCAATGTAATTHNVCGCGEHCSCNPCTCGKAATAAGAGRSCTCGAACTCATCAA